MSETSPENTHDPGAIALSIVGLMTTLGTGEMAALRRLGSGAPVPAYWLLAARHPVLDHNRARWEPIVHALAILTPKGRPEDRERDEGLHDSARRLGWALCDGGQRDWGTGLAPDASPRPLISEQRLAQLLAAKGRQRDTLMIRAIRALAANRDPKTGVDVPDLAWTFLKPDPQRLAAPYYQRLDRVSRAAKSEAKERTRDA